MVKQRTNKEDRTEQRIIAHIKASHPDYAAPSASVTKAFIRLVLRTSDALFAEDFPDLDDLPPTDLSDSEAQELLDSLPKDALRHPLSRETVRLVLETYNDLSYEWYVRDLADQPCNSAADHNNRANALAHFGALGEALEGYGIATALDRNNIVPLLNRAQTLATMGRLKEALEMAKRGFLLTGEGKLQDWKAHLALSVVFLECGRPVQAAMCLDRHITVLRTFSSCVSRAKDSGYVVEIDRNGEHIWARVDFAELSDLARRIGGAFGTDPGWQEHLLDQISEIEGLIRP
jgi:tetratricopeptide (TPR) repeat protein